MNPSLSPRFFELDEYTFQDLCLDLFSRQPGIVTCDIYGPRGQKQHGIDLLARRTSGDEKEVGQCKRYSNFPPREIKEASNAFFLHLEFWKKQNVKRFILFLACDVERTQQQNEIDTQTARFAEHGIEYFAWSAKMLRSKLSSHRDIVFRHTQSDYWVENICGPQRRSVLDQLPQQSNIPLTLGFLGARFERLASRLSDETGKKLEDVREQYRQGRKREALSRLQTLRQDQEWDVLDKPLRARILRVLGTYSLILNGDVSTASDLSTRAYELDPNGDDTIIRVFLRYRTEGAEAALQELSSPNDIDTLNLRVAFQLELGKTTDALSTLGCLPEGIVPNAETFSLQALISLITGNLSSAEQQIHQAVIERPQWESIRFTRAMIEYFSALSHAVIPRYVVTWPPPVEWAFVQRDDHSLQRLRTAATEFEDLAVQCNSDSETQEVYKVWRLACLANDPDRQTEAESFSQHLLTQDPTDHRILAWTLARNYDVDLSTSEEALEASLKEDTDGISEEPA